MRSSAAPERASIVAFLALLVALIAPLVPIQVPEVQAQIVPGVDGTCTVTSGADGGDGSLRQAINTTGCDLIIFANDVTQVVLTTGHLEIDRSLEIRGPDAGTVTILRSSAANNPAFRIMRISGSSNVTLDSLTITDGLADQAPDSVHGGGILVAGTSVVTIVNSTITGNTAEGGGGGIHKDFGARLTISNSIISENEARTGGGVSWHAESGDHLEILNSTIANNVADPGDPNIMGQGGGLGMMANSNTVGEVVPRITLSNSTLSGNSATGHGGGIFAYGAMVFISHSTISGNSAEADASTFYLDPAPLMTTFASIIDGSCMVNGPLLSFGRNIIADDSCISSGGAGDLFGVNPMLDDLQPGAAADGRMLPVHQLMPGSQAIGLVPAGSCLLTDQLGYDRLEPVGQESCDAGAVESPFAAPASTVAVRNTNDDGPYSLRQAIDGVVDGGTITFEMDDDAFSNVIEDGTYVIQLTSGQLEINRDLTIEGPDQNGAPIEVRGNQDRAAPEDPLGGNAFRVIKITGSAVVELDTLTLSSGGAIPSGSDSQRGGGIWMGDSSKVSIRNTSISGNAAVGNGGGIHKEANARLTVVNSTISGNSAFYGGGINLEISGGNNLLIVGSTISGNRAVNNGAGLGHGTGDSGSRITIIDSTISNNQSNLTGAGIRSIVGTLEVINSTISGNEADSGAGAISVGGPLYITGITVVDNSPATLEQTSIVPIVVTGSIIGGADSACENLSSTATGKYNLTNVPGCVDPFEESNIIVDNVADLKLGELADNGGPTETHLPAVASPAIDAIADCSVLEFDGALLDEDQRGMERPFGDGCDIGAVEFRLGTLQLPDDLVVEATGPSGATIPFPVTGNHADGTPVTADDCDAWPADNTFAFGTVTITCETSGDGTVSDSFDVTVEDTTPPTLDNMPADMTVVATSPAGVVVTYGLPTATDLVDPAPDVTCAPPSGDLFPVGGTTVQCTATDDEGNTSAESTFTVTVLLPDAPMMEQPGNISVTSPSPDGLVVEYDLPEASDFNDDPLEVICDPEPGTRFPLGATTVTCTSEADLFGRTVERTFTVSVQPEQNLAPVFTSTPNSIIPTTNPDGTVVVYVPNVSSPIDDHLAVVCDPPSGSFLSMGTHTITCTATDQYGLSSSQTFLVTVVEDDGTSSPPPVTPEEPEEPTEPEEPQEPEGPQEPIEPEEPDAPDTSAFDDVWARTDLPVANGDVNRTWVWGPHPFSTLQEVPTELWEDYAESPDGKRLVRYYDKARMEINQPDAEGSDWYVTNGLLVVELITGMMQVGDDTFIEKAPADVVIAGDLDDPESPTYADLADKLDPVASRVGERITERLNGEGTPGYTVEYAYFDEVTGHNIAEPFWDFMNSSGLVWVDGNLTEDLLFENPFYGTGRPITEAYWVTVDVGGTPHEVLLQCFERRCLTYTPENDPGWQVEAGNVGLHYFIWRYGE